jgi:alpha-N-arabinofuranosidase
MTATAAIRVHADRPTHTVGKYLYSQFVEHLGRCIYGGIWVGEDSKIDNDGGIRTDTLAALKTLELPALRWPGGCFADNYHWMDGVGPRRARPARLNLWWFQAESNAFGTDEFMRFCKLIGAEPYLSVNVGSGTVEETRSWAEYCNSRRPSSIVQMRADNGHPEPYNVTFWGIGNEAWGCGGNLRPEFYADLYRQHATYVKAAAGDDARMIAVGSDPRLPEWDERFLDAMEGCHVLIDFLAVHAYSAWATPQIEFTDDDYARLVIDDVARKAGHIKRTIDLVETYSTPEHTIGVVIDEWGTWYREATTERGNCQQSTMRDALFTAVTFHRFHELAPRLFMANLAQTVNVLQALVLTQGPQLIVTPTYHVWDMFMPHRDARFVPCEIAHAPTIRSSTGKEAPALSISATSPADGSNLFVSVVNLDPAAECAAKLTIAGETSWRIQRMRRLHTGDLHSHNTFDAPDTVAPSDVALDPAASLDRLTFPAQSITTIRLAKR